VQVTPIETRKLSAKVIVETHRLTSSHGRDISDTVSSLAIATYLGEVAIGVVSTAAHPACRALTQAVNPRIIRRLHHLVVLL